MLNLGVGTETIIDGRVYIQTREGANGHAIYGPYEPLEAGDYVVDFTIAPVGNEALPEDFICAWLDVVIDNGQATVADDMVRTSQITLGGSAMRLAFKLNAPATVEYRVHVSGILPLLIADNPVVSRGKQGVEPWPRPAFMIDQRHIARGMYFEGGKVAVVDDHVVATLNGIRFHARNYDDVNFVRELFVLNAYNVLSARPTCVIDIGMNVGLASLQFAAKDFVKEVHAFEPFRATYERGLANIALNPELARKIIANNVGLGDIDGDILMNIHDTGDSGAMQTRNSDQGIPMTVPMREASGALGPIVAAARERGLAVAVKVDCEGSEFPVFASLADHGLLPKIDSFMVEWHRIFPDSSQHTLIAPLLDNGYTVFDLSQPTGNGFFYAVRAAIS